MATTLIPPEALQDHLALTDDVANLDMALILKKLEAAEAHVGRLLGYTLAETYTDADSIPKDLQEAVLQLAAWWYENREAAAGSTEARTLPFGVWEIVNEYREFTF